MTDGKYDRLVVDTLEGKTSALRSRAVSPLLRNPEQATWFNHQGTFRAMR
jgi:hypothetical protein